jgi:hypothetical protein
MSGALNGSFWATRNTSSHKWWRMRWWYERICRAAPFHLYTHKRPDKFDVKVECTTLKNLADRLDANWEYYTLLKELIAVERNPSYPGAPCLPSWMLNLMPHIEPRFHRRRTRRTATSEIERFWTEMNCKRRFRIFSRMFILRREFLSSRWIRQMWNEEHTWEVTVSLIIISAVSWIYQ